jgi:alcohol dehydrogenase
LTGSAWVGQAGEVAQDSDGVVKFQAPEIVFGPGALAEAGFAARRIGAQRPFVVTDPGIIEAGWADELTRHLADVDLPVTTWCGITPNPKDTEIAAGYDRYQGSGCDVIVAVGGGSVIDAAKGVAILTGNGGGILDYTGVDKVTRPIPPMLMIPSTAGQVPWKPVLDGAPMPSRRKPTTRAGRRRQNLLCALTPPDCGGKCTQSCGIAVRRL